MRGISAKRHEKLERLKEQAHQKLMELQEFLTEIGEEAQNYHDDRTDEWQESERGEAFQDWVGDIDSKADDIGMLADEVDGLEFDDILRPADV